ncbi:MAG: class I SAM-dependent methyltransferase [Anaerolineales bacterium]|nr:class I SAM-dependent methyltransferase [Anaerolineales bacterium]
MPLSIQDWHNRFQVQAQWTKALRLYFFNLVNHDQLDKILDIGCGTGVLLPDLQALTPAEIYGADLKLDHHLLAGKTVQKQLSWARTFTNFLFVTILLIWFSATIFYCGWIIRAVRCRKCEE